MHSEHDPLALHIFTSSRRYRNIADTKSGKRREINGRLSFSTACELGFRGSFDEWVRLRGGNCSRSHDAVIGVCGEAGNVIETHEHGRFQRLPLGASLPQLEIGRIFVLLFP
jgi:hypothetical protein